MCWVKYQVSIQLDALNLLGVRQKGYAKGVGKADSNIQIGIVIVIGQMFKWPDQQDDMAQFIEARFKHSVANKIYVFPKDVSQDESLNDSLQDIATYHLAAQNKRPAPKPAPAPSFSKHKPRIQLKSSSRPRPRDNKAARRLLAEPKDRKASTSFLLPRARARLPLKANTKKVSRKEASTARLSSKQNRESNGGTIRFRVKRAGTSEVVRTEPNERSSSRAWKY